MNDHIKNEMKVMSRDYRIVHILLIKILSPKSLISYILILNLMISSSYLSLIFNPPPFIFYPFLSFQ